MIIKKAAALLALLLLLAEGSYAQRRGGGGVYGIRRPDSHSFTGSFTFCRIAFRSAYDGDGGGWGVDYPRADQYTSEDGGRVEEDVALRAYLQKGGFLWADDAWRSYSWDHWVAEIRKVLPETDYPLVDLPMNHSVFHTLFDVKRIPQIPNIGFYQRSGGRTSERGSDSGQARAVAILDSQGRVMVLTTHNTDFGDAYEREGDDPEYFLKFSVEGYAVGINVLLYAMTH